MEGKSYKSSSKQSQLESLDNSLKYGYITNYS